MSQSSFKREILATFRGGWNGNLNTLEIADSLFSNIRRGFNQAWTEGSRSCGILENERTQAETDKLNLLIGDNFQYVGNVAEWIFEHSKKNKVKFSEITYRADLWINRYGEVLDIAKSMACADVKYRWQIDGGEHCRSCLKLNGRVARGSTWASRNIAPRSTNGILKCGGFNCKCVFTQTDQPVTRGRWPNLP